MEKIFGIRLIILVLFFLPAVLQLAGQTTYGHISEGNKHYRAGAFIEAEEQYRKAIEKEGGLPAVFNLADALYQQERYEEAVEYFEKAADQSKTDVEKASCLYNLGNTYFKSGELEKAVEAYKESIRLNPERNEPRYNLAITKEVMKQMKEQQQQQQNNQDQQDNDPQEGEDNPQNEQRDGQQQDQQEGQNGEEGDSQNSEKQDSLEFDEASSFDTSRLDKQSLDSLDAVKLLQIIQSEEQKVQEKLRKFKSNRKKPKKDW